MSRKIVLGITGSIAAYKACDLIGALRKRGHTVKCIFSRDAGKFISPLTVETLSGNSIAKDMFELPEERTPGHVSLAEEADLFVIAPATADIIARVAGGLCDDILSCVACATRAPLLFVPAMNEGMYNNPIIQEKIAYLTEKGYHFCGPVEGNLACGKQGTGHIAALEDILDSIENILGRSAGPAS